MPQRPGTGWVNFQRVLELNKPQAQAMGQKVAQDVGGQAQNALQPLQKAQATFKQQVGAQQLPEPEGIAAQAAGGDPKGAYARAGQAAAQAKAGYQGPSTLADVGADPASIGKGLNAAAGRVASIGSTGGLASALQGLYGRTSMGGGALDAALAGAGGANELAAVRGEYGDLAQRLPRAEQEAMSMAEQARGRFSDAEARYNQLLQQIAEQEAMAERQRLARGIRPLPRFGETSGETEEGTRPYGGRG